MKITCPKCRHTFEYKDPGRVEGGRKSKRVLTPEQARNMVKAREKKRKGERRHGNDLS